MRRIRIYHSQSLFLSDAVVLEPSASRHLTQVLRKKEGDHFYIFNEKEGEFHAEIVSSSLLTE